MKNEERESEVESHGKKIIVLALALVLLIGGTYAWLSITLSGNKTVRLEAGTLSLKLTNESNAIDIEDAFPMTDEEGLETTPYTFTLENDGTIASDYSVFLDSEAIPSGYIPMKQHLIRYSITKTIKTKVGDEIDQANDTTKEGPIVKTETLNPLKTDAVAPDTPETGTNPDRVLDDGVLEADDYIVYTLRLWVDYKATLEEMDQAAFAGKLRIEAAQQGIE